jgi:molybdopterin converting factor small subunit
MAVLPLDPEPFSLRIPFNKVQVVMVNYRAVAKHSTIHPGDRVSLFPREYPVFADWKDFRDQE